MNCAEHADLQCSIAHETCLSSGIAATFLLRRRREHRTRPHSAFNVEVDDRNSPAHRAVKKEGFFNRDPLDGIDVLDVMRGKEEARVRDWFSYIAQGPPERTALCDDTWKMVVTGGSVLDVMLDGGDEKGPKVELFRLDRDPSESENLLKSNPDVAAAMLKRLQTFRRLKIDGIPNFQDGRKDFKAPKDWMIHQ